VLFARAMRTLWDRGVRVCLELGPHPVLVGLAQQGVTEGVCVASLRRGHGDWAHVLEGLGRLYVAGVPVDWAAVDTRSGRRRVSLPTYPFERKRHWLRPATASSPRRATATPAESGASGHPLVGRRLRSPVLKEIVFEARLDLETTTFLGDHRVLGQVVYPAAAYLESVAAAVRRRSAAASTGWTTSSSVSASSSATTSPASCRSCWRRPRAA
jgi:acyl transferase domain-containing protein